MSQTSYIRVFNEAGIIAFAEVLSSIRNGNQEVHPSTILFNNIYSEELEPRIEILNIKTTNKRELIPYIVEILDLKKSKSFYFNKGLWTWLAAFYFDNLCLRERDGTRKLRESSFYILEDPKNFKKYYRHLLAYPSRVLAEIGDAAKLFLVGTFKNRGELTEQFGAYQNIALNKGILEAASILFWEQSKESLKRGASGKGAGSARRFIRIINQYQLTYDLNAMSGSQIAEILPQEFDIWKS